MINIPPVAKLHLVVPDTVIQAILELKEKCKSIGGDNPLMNTKYSTSPLDTHYLQWASPKQIKKFGLDDPNRFYLMEQFRMSTTWLIEDSNTKILNDFVNVNFNTAFGGRIHTLYPSGTIDDQSSHPYPRFFIPATNSNCEYINLCKGVKHRMIFEVGSCYVWDVRYPHLVINHINQERTVAIFIFEPSKETKLSL